jgi:hypothetical protein
MSRACRILRRPLLKISHFTPVDSFLIYVHDVPIFGTYIATLTATPTHFLLKEVMT